MLATGKQSECGQEMPLTARCFLEVYGFFLVCRTRIEDVVEKDAPCRVIYGVEEKAFVHGQHAITAADARGAARQPAGMRRVCQLRERRFKAFQRCIVAPGKRGDRKYAQNFRVDLFG